LSHVDDGWQKYEERGRTMIWIDYGLAKVTCFDE
jgi:hypothetical protein